MQNLYLLICLQLIFIFKLNVQIWGGIPRGAHFPNSAFWYSVSNFPFIMPRSNFFTPYISQSLSFLNPSSKILPFSPINHIPKKTTKKRFIPSHFLSQANETFFQSLFFFSKMFYKYKFCTLFDNFSKYLHWLWSIIVASCIKKNDKYF